MQLFELECPFVVKNSKRMKEKGNRPKYRERLIKLGLFCSWVLTIEAPVPSQAARQKTLVSFKFYTSPSNLFQVSPLYIQLPKSRRF